MDESDAMELCSEAAAAAHAAGGFPNGACVVSGGEVLATSYSRAEDKPDPTAHAEVSAIRLAAAGAGPQRIRGATLVTTLEPCAMCLHAAASAGVARIVYGCRRLEVGDDAYVSSMSAAELADRLIQPIELHHLPTDGIAERVRRFLSSD